MRIWVHELAHAATVIGLTGGRPVVMVGRLPAACVISLRRLEIRWHPSLRAAFCRWDSRGVTVGSARRIVMAGPLANGDAVGRVPVVADRDLGRRPVLAWVEFITTFGGFWLFGA